MPNFALRVLRGGDAVHFQCRCRLCKQPAVDRRSSFHVNRRLAQDDALNVRIRPKGHMPCDLPEHLLRLSLSAQLDVFSRSHYETFRYLKNPHIVRASLQSGIGRHADIRIPAVDAWLEREASDVAATYVDVPGRSARRVSVPVFDLGLNRHFYNISQVLMLLTFSANVDFTTLNLNGKRTTKVMIPNVLPTPIP